MKSILILYTGDDWHLDQPEHKERFKRSYSYWGDLCASRDIKLVRSEINWFNGENFAKYWEYNPNTKAWEKISNNFNPDVVYDKARIYDKTNGHLESGLYNKKILVASKYKFINPPEASLFLDNKINQLVLFNKYLPNSKFVPANTSVNNNSKLVIKLPYGSGGNQVQISEDRNIKISENSIIQDFIDAKVNDELRDYRLVFIGSELVYAASRIAEKDSSFTNTNKGAHSEIVDMNTIPFLVEKAKEISQPLSVFPKLIYSLDFIVETQSNKPYLMEFNSTPGVGVFVDNIEIMELFYSKLTDYLLN